MLKTIHPLLNADVLHALASMGHGDELVITDVNFPSDSVARDSETGKLLRLEAPTAAEAAAAILSLLPLDSFVDHAILRMEVVDEPATVLAVQREVEETASRIEGRPVKLGSLERFAFYERARRAYCIIATGERRFYGNFIIKKGVIAPDA